MKKKRWRIVCILLVLCVLGWDYRYQWKQYQYCRDCLIGNDVPIGDVEDITLHLNKTMSVNDMEWQVDVATYDPVKKVFLEIEEEDKKIR